MTYRKIIASYPDAVLLGLTATPCRGDGRGLGGIFETMIECPQVPDLIKLGFLVPTRTYAPIDPDLRGVHTRHGDYVETSSPIAWIGRAGRRHRHATGTSTASAERPSPSPSTSGTRSTSATNSSGPACAANTSTADPQAGTRRNARPTRLRRDRGRHQPTTGAWKRPLGTRRRVRAVERRPVGVRRGSRWTSRISYASDDLFQKPGVFVDDVVVSTGAGSDVVRERTATRWTAGR